MTLVQELDAPVGRWSSRPWQSPELRSTSAAAQAAELLEGLERLKNAMTAALRDAEQAVGWPP